MTQAADKIRGLIPRLVRPTDSRAESQAGLNGPSGSPTSAPEPVFFQCPACGRSFEVKSEKSERIFCSGACSRV